VRAAKSVAYKEKLIDAIYWVEHIDELRDRYVVTGGVSAGTVTCPHCGAPSEDRATCTYCGAQISAGEGRIYVASASEIPNPILDAQDIIFDRYAAVGGRYAAQESSGLLGGLLELLTGCADADGAMGNKMTEEEIREAAGLYGVLRGRIYLTGLDSGRYMTWRGRNGRTRRPAGPAYQNTYAPRPAAGYAHPAQSAAPARTAAARPWAERPQRLAGAGSADEGTGGARCEASGGARPHRREEPRMENPFRARRPAMPKAPGSAKPGAGRDPRGGGKRRLK
jgi:hypothetical protein